MMEAFSLQKPVVHVLVNHLDIAGEHDQLAFDESIAVPGLIARDFQSVMNCLDRTVSGDTQFDFDVVYLAACFKHTVIALLFLVAAVTCIHKKCEHLTYK